MDMLAMIETSGEEIGFGRAAEGVHPGMAQTACQGRGWTQETQGETSQAQGDESFQQQLPSIFSDLKKYPFMRPFIPRWFQALREQEEKRLAEKKRQEEERRMREAEEKKQREQEEKMRRLEEAERKRQLMLQAQKVN